MARNYILGGMAATQLQAGKPFFKRITRINGTGYIDPAKQPAQDPAAPGVDDLEHPDNILRADDFLTCQIDADGKIDLTAGALNWANEGELLMVEFPTTLRSVQVQLEEATANVRAKVMLTAPGQNTKADGVENIADPVNKGNYIEIKGSETATVSSRTKVVFILIEKFTAATVFTNDGALVGKQANAGVIDDVASILITGVLDHEPTAGGSLASAEPNSIVVTSAGEKSLRKIWGAADGIG